MLTKVKMFPQRRAQIQIFRKRCAPLLFLNQWHFSDPNPCKKPWYDANKSLVWSFVRNHFRPTLLLRVPRISCTKPEIMFSDRHEQAAFDRWQAVRESCAGVWRNEDSHSSAGPRCDNARSVCLLLCLMCHCSSWGDSEKDVQVAERNKSTRERT